MQYLYLVDPHGKLLHSGAKTELIQYVKKHNIKRYNIKSKYIEKVIKFEEISIEPTLPVEVKTQADEKQSIFNRFFQK